MAQSTPFEILLAEDSAADALLVRMALEAYHVVCKVQLLRDGAQAISLLDTLDADPKNPTLDLLLLDMNLPKCNGADILRRLRSSQHYAQTPVIVMSGLAPGAIEASAASQIGTVYFEKPSTLREFMRLGSIVQSVLERNTGGPA